MAENTKIEWTDHTGSSPRARGTLLRLGKARAGRLLDGREHDEVPA